MVNEERVIKMILKMMSNILVVVVVVSAVAMILMVILRSEIAKVPNVIWYKPKR